MLGPLPFIIPRCPRLATVVVFPHPIMRYSTCNPPHEQWLVGLEAGGVLSIMLYVGVAFVPPAIHPTRSGL
jgi:hypothetical protein